MGLPRPTPDKTLIMLLGSALSCIAGTSDSAESYCASSSFTKSQGILTLGFGGFGEGSSDSSCGGGEVDSGEIKPRPRPKGGEFESLFKKEENEGRTGDEGRGFPLPRPWPCGSGDASSYLELLGLLSEGPSTVNWKGVAPPRPLPPPPVDEVEKAAVIEEEVVEAR